MLNKFLPLIENSKKNKVVYIVFLIFLSLIIESLSIGLLIPVIGYFSTTNNIINLNDLFYLLPDYKISRIIFLDYLIFIIFCFFLLRFFFLNYLALKLHSFIGDINILISEKLLRIYLKKDYKWHTNYNKSDFLQILTRDVDNFCGNALYGLLFIIAELFLLVGIIFFLLIYNPKVFFVVIMVSIFFFPLLYFFTKKYSYTLGKKNIDSQNYLLKTLNERLSGIKELILYNWRSKVHSDFTRGQNNLVKSAALFNSLQDISRYTIEFLAVIFFLAFIFYLNLKNDTSSSILTIGIFSVALFRLMPIMNRISTYSQRLKFGISAADKIITFYKNSNTKENLLQEHEFNSNLSLKNVSYRHDKNKEVLFQNIFLELNKNEIIGIVGENGVGKTTLSNIIMGLIKPTSGEIMVDGVDIIKNDKSIGKNIGFVSQNFFSIDTSILNNIVFFEKKINISNLKFAIKNSLLIDTILNRTLSLKTELGNNSLKISGGQLQRINIARALYKRPKILILDEPTSAQDDKNQKLFEKILVNLKNKMCIIVITHDLQFSNRFDRIYKIENKKLIQLKKF